MGSRFPGTALCSSIRPTAARLACGWPRPITRSRRVEPLAQQWWHYCLPGRTRRIGISTSPVGRRCIFSAAGCGSATASRASISIGMVVWGAVPETIPALDPALPDAWRTS